MVRDIGSPRTHKTYIGVVGSQAETVHLWNEIRTWVCLLELTRYSRLLNHHIICTKFLTKGPHCKKKLLEKYGPRRYHTQFEWLEFRLIYLHWIMIDWALWGFCDGILIWVLWNIIMRYRVSCIFDYISAVGDIGSETITDPHNSRLFDLILNRLCVH